MGCPVFRTAKIAFLGALRLDMNDEIPSSSHGLKSFFRESKLT